MRTTSIFRFILATANGGYCSDAPLNLAPELPSTFPHVEIYTDGQDGRTVDERWREHWVPRPVWKNLHTNSPISITDLPGVPYPAGSVRSTSLAVVCRFGADMCV